MFLGREKSFAAMELPVKKLVAPALFAVLAVTGCAASQATEPAPSAVVLPSPNAEQRTALLEQLDSVDPELAPPRSIAAARLACAAIQAGKAVGEQTEIVESAFKLTGGKQITPEQAAAIVAIVQDNGFCTKS